MRIKKNILILFVMLIFPASVFAAPAVVGVSSSVSNGSEIIISGSDFGSGPNVHFFTDFEQGTVGSIILTGAGSAEVGEISTVNMLASRYSNDSFSGDLSFQTSMVDDGSGKGHVLVTLPDNTREVFASWYIYLPSGDNYPGEGGPESINWKQMWIIGKDINSDGLINDWDLVIPTLLGRSDGTDLNWIIDGNSRSDGGTFYTAYPDSDPNFTKGQWSRFTTWLKAGETDGEVWFSTTDTSDATVVRKNSTGVYTADPLAEYESVTLNAYGRTAVNSHPTFDDLYIATGPSARARVEIGNASTYPNCTKFAVATPTIWTSSSITANAWTSAFNNGDPVYLYVVDENGEVNANGYPITIGSGSDTTPPSSPVGLSVC